MQNPCDEVRGPGREFRRKLGEHRSAVLQSLGMNTLGAVVVVVAGVLLGGTAMAQGGYSVVNGQSAVGGGPGVVSPTSGRGPMDTPPPPPGPGSNPQGAIGVMPSAQGETRVASRDVPEGRARRPEEYGGLSPGMPTLHRGLRRMLGVQRNSPYPVVAWPGFQMVPGGSRLFLATTRPLTVLESTPAPLVRVLHLANARVVRSNHRRPLETVAFETPLVRAVLRPVRGGLDLVMTLRAETTIRTTQEPGSDGLSFLFVEFPPFALPEVARIQMPNGQTVIVEGGNRPRSNAPPTGAPPPGMPTPVSTGPGVVVDGERPPPVQR